MSATNLSPTTSRWLGWAVLLLNGVHFVWGLVSGEVGGFGSLVNPDRLPSLDYERGWYFAIMAIYLVLTGLGLWLIMTPAPATGEQDR